MPERTTAENIIRRRMHGLYLSRKCSGLETLAHELLGLHSWFYRNVPFSALIRGADISGWKTRLTKTWLYRGTLHGVTYEDLPELLSLGAGGSKEDGWFSWLSSMHGDKTIRNIADEIIREMEDGVHSRAEFRKIFAGRYKPEIIDSIFSSWGGIFVCLARRGKVAFRDMASRDFDLISAEPSQSFGEVLPPLLRRYFLAYGPATFADAAWFFGIGKEDAKKLPELPLDDLSRFEHGGKIYYCGDENDAIGDIPELTLLSGFDPIMASYTADDRLCLPQEHKSKVILKSGICLPTVAVSGQVAGIWNIKKNAPEIEFFDAQPKRIKSAAFERVESIIEHMSNAEDESIQNIRSGI
ncbi:MAG: winged helix DNA-binding domain-containing protein [Oscillospiraceae bacterium]|nr:winged helix DNA-binding domain-containing protein [Oscillospiraceae bacterium]